jgi:Electron transfer DM13
VEQLGCSKQLHPISEGVAQGKDFVARELSGVELGPMKANQGDQNYDLPDSADLSRYDAVVIYCVRFCVVFGLAKLEKF